MAKWNPELVEAVVQQFVGESDDLRQVTYNKKAGRRAWPSHVTIAKHSDRGDTFFEVAHSAGVEFGGDREFVWPTCPLGELSHFTETSSGEKRYEKMTAQQWQARSDSRTCGPCAERYEERREAQEADSARIALLPTFREALPDVVEHLFDPLDADTKYEPWPNRFGGKCHLCFDRVSASDWDPGANLDADPPTCRYCKATNGQPPGSLIDRAGGGTRVALEQTLARAIAERGYPAWKGVAIVVPQGSYLVPAIAPDIVIPSLHLAIELDNSKQPKNQHMTPDGVADDQKRDGLLEDFGWEVIRVRRPDAPIDRSWPWRVETTSVSPNVIANLIVAKMGERR